MKRMLWVLAVLLFSGCTYQSETGVLTSVDHLGNNFENLHFQDGTIWFVKNRDNLPLYVGHNIKVTCEMGPDTPYLRDIKKLDEDIPQKGLTHEIPLHAIPAKEVLLTAKTFLGDIIINTNEYNTSYVNDLQIEANDDVVVIKRVARNSLTKGEKDDKSVGPRIDVVIINILSRAEQQWFSASELLKELWLLGFRGNTTDIRDVVLRMVCNGQLVFHTDQRVGLPSEKLGPHVLNPKGTPT